MSLSLKGALALLKEKTVDKNLNQLKLIFKEVNQKGFEGSLTSINTMVDKLGGLDVALSPLKLLFESIKAETVEGSMELFQAVLELVKSDGAKEGVRFISEMLNYFLSTELKESVQNFTSLLNSFQGLDLGFFGKTFKWFIDYMWIWEDLFAWLEKIVEKIKEWVEAIGKINDAVEKANMTLNIMGNTLGLFKTETVNTTGIITKSQMEELLALMHAAVLNQNNGTNVGDTIYNPYDPTNGGTLL